jgi:hypothetical protein
MEASDHPAVARAQRSAVRVGGLDSAMLGAGRRDEGAVVCGAFAVRSTVRRCGAWVGAALRPLLPLGYWRGRVASASFHGGKRVT